MDDFFAEEEKLFEDYGTEETVYASEVKAFERAGPSGKLSEMISTIKLSEIGKKGRDIISAEDRFLINVDAFCRRLTSENIAKLTQKDIDTLLEKTSSISNIRFKNYVGYVLGYLATQGGISLNIDKVKNVINNILPKLEGEGSVMAEDVVRYSRYWKQYL
jgi:hypothetical protein